VRVYITKNSVHTKVKERKKNDLHATHLEFYCDKITFMREKVERKNMKRMSTFLLEKFNEIEKIHWWWEGRRELIKLMIGKKKPSKVLDVGCGTGETLSFIQKLYPKAKVYGVDTSSIAIKYAKQRGHKLVYKSRAESLPFKDGTFDTILFLDVLEHIKDDQVAVDEAKRVLKKGGLILITSPALSFIWSAHDSDQGHKRRYTRRAIRKLANKSGLKIDFVSYFNFFLSFPIIIIRLLSNLKDFRFLSNYDSGINYDIVKKGIINNFLKYLFVSEIRIIKQMNYPIGISVFAMFRK